VQVNLPSFYKAQRKRHTVTASVAGPAERFDTSPAKSSGVICEAKASRGWNRCGITLAGASSFAGNVKSLRFHDWFILGFGQLWIEG
jgi:hypothetical protein